MTLPPGWDFGPPTDPVEELRKALQDVIDHTQDRKRKLIYQHALVLLGMRGRLAAEMYLYSRGYRKT